MCDSDKNKQQKIYSFIYEEQKLQQHSETLITYDKSYRERSIKRGQSLSHLLQREIYQEGAIIVTSIIKRDLSRGINHCQIYYKERSIKRDQSLSHLLQRELYQEGSIIVTSIIKRDLSRGSNHCHIYYRERSIKRDQSLSHLL